MRILLITTLFPNAAKPSHGVFVENRLTAYRKKYDAEVKVIAPAPWFPFKHSAFGAYADFASVPETEMRNGVEVRHPRYLIPPKLAMNVAPAALTRCLRKAVCALVDDGWDFDLIDAHYFYPDGVAALQIAREFDRPIVITARGTDVNRLPDFARPRAAILDAAFRADAVVTVAGALKDELARLGAPSEKITVLRNGVDLEMFKPADREQERRVLGVDGLVLASVGHLIERKGHELVIDALGSLSGATLLIVGEGPQRKALEARAQAAGVADRVRFLGRADHKELRGVYAAADVLVLASSREGWPNVLLEAMACGAPCVATNVWGSGEVIAAKEAGRLANERSAESIATEIKKLLASPPGRKATRAYAERFSWDETADGMDRIFRELAQKTQASRAVTQEPVAFADESYRPRLMVTVDTEEQFDWRSFENLKWRVNDVEGLQRFQQLCSDAEVRPLYFLTLPMMNDVNTSAFFGRLAKAEKADMGLHLHQWVTPPGDYRGEFYSYQKNLPRAVHRAKLKTLCDAFADVFGDAPLSHRAGRYGIAKGDYELLAECGVQYDFSPSAGFDFSARGGPDFSNMSSQPFSAIGADWRVWVTPVSGALAIRRTRSFLSQTRTPAGFLPYRAMKSPGMMRAMRLSPEGASLTELQALTRRLVADKTKVLTLTLHSTSLTPGANDYGRDEESVAALTSTTAAYLDWFKTALGGELISFTDLKDLYAANRGDD